VTRVSTKRRDRSRSRVCSPAPAQALAQQSIRVVVVKPEGTSELDASPDADKADEVDDTGDTSDVSDTDRADDSRKADAGDNARPAAAPRDPVPSVSGIERSIAALDPALQEKLGRVMARMRDETGHDVAVGETYRSQSRQNVLFAQGRSSPGPVVTWTQSSKHTQGRAVDLLIDGGSAGRDVYATLRRIAGEEGLRSLGERDPGHLELPAELPRAIATRATSATNRPPAVIATTPVMPADAPAPAASVATVARVAPPARAVDTGIARPADVARVASVARPMVTSSLTRAAALPQPAPVQLNIVGLANRAPAGDQRFGANSEERSQQNASDRDGTPYGAAYGIGKRASEFTVPNVVATTATSTTQRVVDVVAAREDAPARPLSQIVMSVDAGNGTTDRIQLDLRGSSLNAKIDTGDLHAAHEMGARKSELVRALTRDGLEVESLEVRAAATVATPAAAESAHLSSDSSSNARSERGAQWQQQQHRQRSENERRQQQRYERGGKK
jgi:hypothetical protein